MPMNVSLTPELETLINDKVKTGCFHSASEVVREALRLLEEQDKLKQLRREIQKGVDDIRGRRYRTVSSPEEMEEMIEEIVQKGRRKAAERK